MCAVAVPFNKESLEFFAFAIRFLCLFAIFIFIFRAYWVRNFNFEMCGSSFSFPFSVCVFVFLYLTQLPSKIPTKLLFIWLLCGWIQPSSMVHVSLPCMYIYAWSFFQRKSFRLIYIPSSLRLCLMMNHNSSFVIISFLIVIIIVSCNIYQPTYLIVHYYFVTVLHTHRCGWWWVWYIYICTYGCRYFYCCWNANAMHDIKTGWMKKIRI